eukprot:gene25331-30921_t
MDTSTVLTEEITSDLRQKIVDMVERRKEIESHTKRKTDVVNIELNGARAFQERVSSSSVAQRKATETSGEGVAEENTETLGEGVAEENTRVRRFNELKYSDQNGLDDSSASVEDDPSASVEDDSSASVSKPAPTPCIGMMDFSPMVNIPPDLSALADWSTCAVVGGSATLQKQLKGAEIDRHSAVFRFNDAPVQGFERMVGSKTTIRIHNRVISNCPMEGGPGRERQLCFFYSQENQPISAERRCMARVQPSSSIKYGTCREVHPNYRLLRYVHSYWRKHPAPVNENTGKNFSTPASKISA